MWPAVFANVNLDGRTDGRTTEGRPVVALQQKEAVRSSGGSGGRIKATELKQLELEGSQQMYGNCRTDADAHMLTQHRDTCLSARPATPVSQSSFPLTLQLCCCCVI